MSNQQELLAQAHAVHNSGDFEAAVAAFETVVTQFPNCGEGWFGLGTIALQNQHYEPAIQMLNKAIECDGMVPIYFINLGEAYRRVAKYEAAIAVLKVACDLDPENADAWLNYGVALGDSGDTVAADQALQKAIDNGTLNPSAYRNMGVAKMKQGEWEEAGQFFQMALGLAPESCDAWCGMGETLRHQQHFAEAVNAFRKALTLDAHSPVARNGLAGSLYLAGEKEEAKAVVEALLAENPRNQGAWVAQGGFYGSEGAYDEAIESYKKAIEIAPLEEGPYLMLASVYCKREEYAQAGEILLRAIAMRPRDVVIMRELAEVYVNMGELGAAITLLKQTVAIAPDDYKTLLALGQLLVKDKKLKEADPHFKKAVDLMPTSATCWNAYSWNLYRLDRLDEAMAAIDRGLEVCPDSNLLKSNRGAVYFDMGDLGKAIESFGGIVKAVPLDYSAWSNLGMVYAAQGNKKKARACFDKAFEITAKKGMTHSALIFNSGSFELQTGNMKEGWSRVDKRDIAKRYDHLPSAPWQGEPLAGKRLLIWEDQGIGDQIMFSSIYQEVIDQAGHVVIECMPKLIPLLRRSFPKATVVPKQLPQHPLVTREDVDYRIPSAGLGHWFRADVSAFPRSKKPFIKLDPTRKAYWKERLAQQYPGEILVGVCWRSSLRTSRRSQSYATVEHLKDFFQTPGVRFVNLQYDKCDDELEIIRKDYGVDIVNFDELDMYNDLDETAAMTCCLDLVISVPTSVLIMAGATGTRTWAMVRFCAWTMLGTRRLPFLPSVEKVYRRKWNEGWDGVLTKVRGDLAAWVAKRR